MGNIYGKYYLTICRVEIQFVGLSHLMADIPSANYQGIEK